MRIARAVLSCFAWLAAGGAFGAYEIPQHVIAGGGGTSAGGSFALTGTIGQSVVGQSSGGNFAVFGGFWGGGSLTPLDILVNLTLAGVIGGGSVASVPPGIACPGTCSFQFNSVASVSLTGTPANGSNVFTGWLGPCTGTDDCVLASAGTQNVTATFAPNDVYAFRLDVDKNNQYDAMTDGLLVIRGLFNPELSGNGLILGAIGANAGITTAGPMRDRITYLKPVLDVDGNGIADAFTDGVMIIRYLAGMRGDAVSANAIGNGATRNAQQIVSYIQSLLP